VRLERDRWQAGEPDRIVVDDPEPGELDAALRALDQRVHTELLLAGHDGQYLVVEGGAGRYFVLLGSDEHDDAIVAQSPGAAGDEEITVAGRTRRLPRRCLVDLAAARDALRSFATDGRPASALDWAPG